MLNLFGELCLISVISVVSFVTIFILVLILVMLGATILSAKTKILDTVDKELFKNICNAIILIPTVIGTLLLTKWICSFIPGLS